MSASRSASSVALALVITGVCLALAAHRAPAAAVSREALASGFDSGIRNLVAEWDPNDRRPIGVRRAALFDFMYETYDASAWIPQSLFDSNLLTQAIVGDVQTIVGEKVGLVLWRDNPRVPAFGMAPNARDTNAPLAEESSTRGACWGLPVDAMSTPPAVQLRLLSARTRWT